MVEYINLLRTVSFLLIALGFVLIALAAFIVWKFNLFDYYRVKRGKPKKNNKDDSQASAPVAQYYSEQLSDNESHEIDNDHFMADDSDELENKIVLGESSEGIVNQIIDDDEHDAVSFDISSNSDDIVEETTALYSQTSKFSEYRADEGADETSVLDTEGSEETSILDNQGVEETSVLSNDEYLDQTDAIDFSKITYADDSFLDQTDLIDIPGDMDEGVEETTVLFDDKLDETDTVDIPDYEETLSVSGTNSDSNKTFESQLESETSFGLNEEARMESPVYLDAALNGVSNDDLETDIYEDTDGEGETTILSNQKTDLNAELSKKLWAKQSNVFVNDDEESVVVSIK